MADDFKGLLSRLQTEMYWPLRLLRWAAVLAVLALMIELVERIAS